MAKLGPDIITEEINIDDDDSSTETEGSSGSCNSVHCQQQMKGELCCWIDRIVLDKLPYQTYIL